jgi:formylmethanofuran dehydrogenase subunit C
MTLRLRLRHAPALRVDARALVPAALAPMALADLQRLRLPHGRDALALGELFDVERRDDGADDALELAGDLSRFDLVGAGLAAGSIEVDGAVGDAAGLAMTGGRLVVRGNARDLVACSLRGGWLEVHGDIGDFAASPLPGERDGMRGGTLLVHGRAGERLADGMRRGTVVVMGDAGDFAGSRMVAGTLALGGRCGAHAGWGMRRGTMVFAGAVPAPPPTFVAVHGDAPVFWQLLARDLARFGGPFAGLPGRGMQRLAGDVAVQGHGEWLLPAG